MEEMKLSKKGNDLIKLYEEMVEKGIQKVDGTINNSAYNFFQLKKFRSMVKDKLSDEAIKTVLDYGSGGSDWDAPNFDSQTNQSAKDFFQIHNVDKFEPARGLMEKKKADCVVCMDVLEHIFIEDIPKVVDELFFLAKKLLIVNVACYKAAALLPNGENAHITIRSPDWWKGVFDVTASNYKDTEFMLICSITISTGVRYETFKFSDYSSVEGFKTKSLYTVFGKKNKSTV